MSATARLLLPFLAPGQAQKELFHNEALQLLDLLVAAAVEEGPRQSPPGSPANGACYIVGSAPTGAWAGKAHCLAGYTAGGWRFAAAFEGLTAFVRTTGTCATFRSGAWEVGSLRGAKLLVDGLQVVGARAAAVADPSGGASVDAEARAAIGQVLAVLRGHGLIAT